MSKKRTAKHSNRRKRISLNDPATRVRFEQAHAYWMEKARPLIEAVEASGRLTAADYGIRFNI